MTEEERRKHDAKRFNEHVKLLVTTVNATALVILAASVLQPIIVSGPLFVLSEPVNWFWIGLGIALHICAQALIRLFRPE